MRQEWSRNVTALAAYNAFRGFTVGGFMTLLPMYMKYLGYSMNNIGGIITVWSVFLSILLPTIGYIIDKYGSRPMIIATGILLIISTLQAAISRSLLGLGVAYGLFFFSFLAGQPARMNFLTSSVGVFRMGEAVGLTSSLFSASRTIGPMAVGLLARYYGFQLAFTSLTLAATIGIVLFIVLSEPVYPTHKNVNLREAYRYLIKPPKSFAVVLGYVSIDRFAWSLWFPMLSAHLYASGYSEDEVGYIITFSGVVRTVLMPFAGKLVDKLGASLALAGSELLGILSAVLYAFPENWILITLAALFMGVSFAWWVPGYNSLIARVAGGSGGAYAAANTARSLLGSPAPVTGGYLYDAVAPWTPFGLSSILLFAAAVYSIALLKRVEETSITKIINEGRTARSTKVHPS